MVKAQLAAVERNAFSADGTLLHPRLLDSYRRRASLSREFFRGRSGARRKHQRPFRRDPRRHRRRPRRARPAPPDAPDRRRDPARPRARPRPRGARRHRRQGVSPFGPGLEPPAADIRRASGDGEPRRGGGRVPHTGQAGRHVGSLERASDQVALRLRPAVLPQQSNCSASRPLPRSWSSAGRAPSRRPRG